MSRLNELLHQAGSIGRNEDGSITRVGFSREYFQALEFLKGKMEELGMRTETDPVGNLHGILPGTDPKAGIIAIGSHLDTVIKGGLYDGMLGVAGAIEAAAPVKGGGAQAPSFPGNLGVQYGRIQCSRGDLWKPLCDRKDRSGRAGL